MSNLLLSLLFLVPLVAHHNTDVVFDKAKRSTLQGPITKVSWANPHAWVAMDIREDSGKVVTWSVELASTTTLTKAGLDGSLIQLNQTYSMDVFRAKDGSTNALGVTLTFPNGKIYDVGDK